MQLLTEARAAKAARVIQPDPAPTKREAEALSRRLLTVGPAARYLGLSVNTLRKRSDLGQIPCIRDGAQRRFDIQALDRWIESRPKWVDRS
jgi:excisionase family DNA binding protein